MYELELLYQIKTIYVIEVHNNGSTAIEDMTMILPFEGLFEIIDSKEDESFLEYSNDLISVVLNRIYMRYRRPYILDKPYIPRVKSFNKEIELGKASPSERFILVVWTNDSPPASYYSQNKIRITYPNGVVRVDFPRKVRGLLSWADNNMAFIVGGLIGLVFWIFILLTIKLSNSERSNVDEDKPT